MDTADLIFLVIGIGALAAALLPQLLDGKPLSLPIVFLVAGLILGAVPVLPFDIRPAGQEQLIEHFTEIVVMISLMGAGLGLDRRIGWRRWSNTWRLLMVALPLTILCVGLLGWGLLGLTPAAAILLGAALAPTDPVLAGEVQVGEPATEPVDDESAEDEVRFSLTSEAGLNDALVFPFVYLAITVAGLSSAASSGGSWVAEWIAVDLLYRVAIAVLSGIVSGWLLGKLFFATPNKVMRLADHREGFVAIAATFLAYGFAEVAQGYGFLAVFVAAVTIRGSERFHSYHVVLHRFVEQVERLLTVLVLLVLGAAISSGLFSGVGWAEIITAAAVLFLIRPLSAGLALVRGAGYARERLAIAFFGVRGVGPIYYASYGFATAGMLTEQHEIYAIVGMVIAGSVLLHGFTAGPVMRKLDAQMARSQNR